MTVLPGQAQEAEERFHSFRGGAQVFEADEVRAFGGKRSKRTQDDAVDLGPMPGDSLELIEGAERVRRRIATARNRPPKLLLGWRERIGGRIVVMRLKVRGRTVVVAFVAE